MIYFFILIYAVLFISTIYDVIKNKVNLYFWIPIILVFPFFARMDLRSRSTANPAVGCGEYLQAMVRWKAAMRFAAVDDVVSWPLALTRHCGG